MSHLRKLLPAAWAVVVCLLASPGYAQRSLSGETRMRLMLDELQNTGSVMMIAAHPDDENTALLAYLARGRHVRTAYLSITRGEGGQNLIGTEQGDELGILRTEELLAARRIDGAEQYFTRAIDFGFTKTADEALTKWSREKVLGDVVWAIRRFRPDVIILRFSGTPRDGHGQHQASAILGREAFSAAADSRRYPEQLKYVKPWQAKRLMMNLANFNAEQEKEIEKIPDKLAVDLGAYSPELGYSYNEIAGMSRSQHRSQAMGTPERKGSVINYLVTEKGDKARKDIFDDINITWSRIEGGAPVETLLSDAAKSFAPEHPEAILSTLAKTRTLIADLASKDDPIAQRKLTELDETIALAGGVSAAAQADKFQVIPGANLKVTLSAIARNPDQVTLEGASLTGMDGLPVPSIAAAVLVPNKTSEYPFTVKVPGSQPYSQPYWLEQPKDGSLYTVANPQLIGDPENPPVISATFRLKVGGAEITLKRPVEHRYVDRVYGELVRPLAIVPPVSLEFGGTALVFADNKPRRVEVPVKANTGKTAGDLALEIPAGWKIEPASQHFELNAADEMATLAFELTPPSTESQGDLRAVATVGDRKVTTITRVIDYPHIPAQTLFPPAESKLVRAEIRTISRNIGYVMGAGDEVPDALRQMGCEVTLLSKDDLIHGDLSHFDAIVTGVRAWNVRADLRANYQRLYQYVDSGGTLVVQYNTGEGGGPGSVAPPNPNARPGAPGSTTNAPNPSAVKETANSNAAPQTPVEREALPPRPAPGDPTGLEHIGPYPIKESRDNKDRVVDENALIGYPNPQLPLLHSPNEITARDFEGWVQERGLDFAIEWDPRYQSVLESHDPGEQPKLGGMLYTRYGKGVYIFTAYAWFRQLPAGVPGAYRMFSNMLSAGKVVQEKAAQ